MAIRTMRLVNTATARSLCGAAVTSVACVGVLYLHTPPSVLVLFLVGGICSSSTFVVLVETYLYAAMEADFWKLMFEYLLKLFQFITIAIALIVSALGAISGGGLDMTTTLAYSVAVIVIQGFVIAYLNLLPLWDRVAESHRIADSSEAQR